ncbi:MAG TPA: MASE2 domain-containing protein [Burkholderiales bacterium]
MPWQLPRAHRLARINYPTRSGSFAFSFLVLVAVLAERGFSAGTLVFGVVTLLIYPQLAYLHARLAVDSKRAEFRNLIFDSVLMGLWAAQLHFALWPVCAALTGVSMDNAVCGGIGRFLSGLLYFAAAALLWAVAQGVPFEPSTGPVVTGLCFFGIVGYVGRLAVFFHDRNSRLVRTRNVLRTSEEQFRFIAEHAGDLVSVLTPEHRFRYASPSHQKYFESAKFVDGADWLELVHPEDRGRARAFLDLLSKSPRSERAQLRMMPAGAPPRMVECQGNPVREEGGRLQMIVLLCRDLIVSDEPELAGLRSVLSAGSVAPNGAGS